MDGTADGDEKIRAHNCFLARLNCDGPGQVQSNSN
jgi:hypothetical protein